MLWWCSDLFVPVHSPFPAHLSTTTVTRVIARCQNINIQSTWTSYDNMMIISYLYTETNTAELSKSQYEKKENLLSVDLPGPKMVANMSKRTKTIIVDFISVQYCNTTTTHYFLVSLINKASFNVIERYANNIEKTYLGFYSLSGHKKVNCSWNMKKKIFAWGCFYTSSKVHDLT